MDRQLLYLIFGLVLVGVIQAAWIDNANRGGAAKNHYKRQIEGGCFYNMCNETVDYPEDEIRKLVEKTPAYKELFGTVVKPRHQISLGSRFGQEVEIEDDKGTNMCGTITHYTTPKSALDVHGVWQTVVNGEGMEQLIEYETCDEDAACVAKDQIPGQEVFCRLQQIIIRLFVYTKTSSGDSVLQLKSFAVPAGCYCASKFNDLRRSHQQIND